MWLVLPRRPPWTSHKHALPLHHKETVWIHNWTFEYFPLDEFHQKLRAAQNCFNPCLIIYIQLFISILIHSALAQPIAYYGTQQRISCWKKHMEKLYILFLHPSYECVVIFAISITYCFSSPYKVKTREQIHWHEVRQNKNNWSTSYILIRF